MDAADLEALMRAQRLLLSTFYLPMGYGAFLLLLVTSWPTSTRADQIPVRFPQGSAHGFVEVLDAKGTRLAVGDLLQRTHGDRVSSELLLNFLDGSVDDETTVFTQHGVFRLISDHHVQRGPSFPQPIDVTVDARRSLISSVDAHGQAKTVHFAMPADTYNGLAATLLMDLPHNAPETKIALVIAGDTPRLAHLTMKPGEDERFTIGGTNRMAIDYVVHVELGGVAGIVAPVIGKQPPDYHVWILGGPDPAFIREEGPLYEAGPIWRIQQISPTLPK